MVTAYDKNIIFNLKNCGVVSTKSCYSITIIRLVLWIGRFQAFISMKWARCRTWKSSMLGGLLDGLVLQLMMLGCFCSAAGRDTAKSNAGGATTAQHPRWHTRHSHTACGTPDCGAVARGRSFAHDQHTVHTENCIMSERRAREWEEWKRRFDNAADNSNQNTGLLWVSVIILSWPRLINLR